MTQLYQVDAFAERPFAGNPAAVCLVDAEQPESWMQSVAAEMNLSETAFVRERADSDFDLRWFTPVCEVDLCGHATLASAHVLDRDAVVFHTKSGALRVVRDEPGYRMDFPAMLPVAADMPAGLASALGANTFEHMRSIAVSVCVFSDAATVLALRPDFGALARVNARAVLVTAPGGTRDFVSRFFAPAMGISEDPVTGSAHCTLAPLWCGRLGQSELTGYQASARGGAVRVSWKGGDRVTLAGRAVTVLRGELSV